MLETPLQEKKKEEKEKEIVYRKKNDEKKMNEKWMMIEAVISILCSWPTHLVLDYIYIYAADISLSDSLSCLFHILSIDSLN